MPEVAKLSFGDRQIDLPVHVGSESEHAVDISKLRAETGLITLDEGYVNTGATSSAITFLDGETGILRYRGYPIESLAEHCDFLEVSYLLIYGKLPTATELETFRASILNHSMIHEDMRSFYNSVPRDAHPMAILAARRSGDPPVAREVAYDRRVQL
jgi:citrate synthase